MNTKDAVSNYIEDCELRNLAPSTIRGYRWALERYVKRGGELPSTPGEVQKVIGMSGVADDTLHDLWRASKTFYRWLARVYGEDNLMADIPPPRVRRRFPRALTDEEVRALFASAESIRDLALIALLLETGARVGEAASLRRVDVSAEGVELFGKTGARFVPLSKQVFDLLERVGDNANIWLGSRGPLTVHGVSLAMRRVMKKAGLKPPKAGPHTLRLTFAKRFLRQGGSPPVLLRLMGHSTIESTMIYAKMVDRDLVAQHKRFGPLNGIPVGDLAAKL